MAEVATSTLPKAELTAEEALRLAPIAHARMVGSEQFVFWYQVLGFAVGVVLGAVIGGLVPIMIVLAGGDATGADFTSGFQLAGGVLGLVLGMRQAQRRHQRDFLRGIRARGAPTVLSTTYRLDAGTLHLETQRISYSVPIGAILEIVAAPEHWLLQVDLTTYIVPKRAFVDEAAERDFVGELLSGMPQAARESSTEAVAFAS